MSHDSTVHYIIPEDSQMEFGILPHERYISLQLLTGTAEIYIDYRGTELPLEEEFHYPVWECSNPILRTTSGCSFIFRGNHYVYSAIIKIESIYRTLFYVSMTENTSVFVLNQNIQLQVLARNAEAEVTIARVCGHPKLFINEVCTQKNVVPLHSSLLVNTLGTCWYSVKIKGQSRKIKLSLSKCITRTEIINVHNRLAILHMTPTYEPPIILLLDCKNLGITSFCHFLMNYVNTHKLSPMFIDLDVYRNWNTKLFGAISAAEMGHEQHFNTVKFSYLAKYLLYFGHLGCCRTNIHLYYFLIRRMGALLTSTRNCKNIKNYGAIIHLQGVLAMHPPTIKCILESFPVKYVIFIGEETHYHNMKSSAFENILSNVISQPQIATPRHPSSDSAEIDLQIRKYFFDTIRHPEYQTRYVVDTQCIHIYRVSTNELDENETNVTINDLRFEPVVCDRRVEYAVLAVSKTTFFDTRNPTVDVMEIKYFVCIVKVDMSDNTAFILSPNAEIIYGGVLLIGDIWMTRD